ncbi:MAG: NAD(P)H-binding protein [Hyphomicrobiales bacterium]|nr:NAD(P)H-binding protein [Hyphomicrobiales bacterium]MCP5000904.1 NAD(P)H-binding protein [Hyphomicrobiales bacterium]
MKHKNVLVLGASGATGRWGIQIATERGHHVTALVRSKENIQERDGLEII